MLPAGFFFAWGAWWCLCLFSTYVGCLASKRPFVTRGWWGLPCSPARLRGLPLEPLVKVALPLVGILGELWLGHDSFRVLYLEDGHFTDHLNDWQHAAMYTCFVVSGVVDLLGHALGLPQGAELVSPRTLLEGRPAVSPRCMPCCAA